jgi:hypothetical protein
VTLLPIVESLPQVFIRRHLGEMSINVLFFQRMLDELRAELRPSERKKQRLDEQAAELKEGAEAFRGSGQSAESETVLSQAKLIDAR